MRLDEANRAFQQRTQTRQLNRRRRSTKKQGVIPVDDDAFQRDFVELGVGVPEVLLVFALRRRRVKKQE
jgi:hypothetical protein